MELMPMALKSVPCPSPGSTAPIAGQLGMVWDRFFAVFGLDPRTRIAAESGASGFLGPRVKPEDGKFGGAQDNANTDDAKDPVCGRVGRRGAMVGGATVVAKQPAR